MLLQKQSPEAFLEVLQNSQENHCQNIFFNKVQPCDFIKKETLVHVLSCEFCEISKNSYSYRTPPVAASATLISRYLLYFCKCNNVKPYSNAFLTIDERCFHENFNISHEIITPSSCSK